MGRGTEGHLSAGPTLGAGELVLQRQRSAPVEPASAVADRERGAVGRGLAVHVLAVVLDARLRWCGGRVTPPAPHVGEGETAVLVIGLLLEQSDESRLSLGQPAGPALQLGHPETVLPSAPLARRDRLVGGQRLGEALGSAESLGLGAAS